MIDTNSIHRILMIRLSALGDCVVALPVLMALRRQFPDRHIAWAIQDQFVPLLKNVPGLDEVIVFPRQRWKHISSKWNLVNEAWSVARHIRMRRFDAVIDIQGNTKSGTLSLLSRARYRIGHGKEEAKELNRWFNNIYVSPETGMDHIIQRNLNLLSPLGITNIEPEFSIPVDKPSRAAIKTWLAARGMSEKQYILLVPFCGNTIKEWPKERFTQLSVELALQHKKVMFLKSPGKEQETEAMIPNDYRDRIVLGPTTNLSELIELVRLSQLCIGGDTGPLQIAGALQVANIALFGPTASERSHPWKASVVKPLESSASDIAETVLQLTRSF